MRAPPHRALAGLAATAAILSGARGVMAADTAGSPEQRRVEPAPHFADRPLDAEVRAGAGTAVGILGATFDYSLAEQLALGLGAGMNPWGFVWGFHGRFRIFESEGTHHIDALTLEVSFSRSRYGTVDPFGSLPDSPELSPVWVSWIQGDLGWERRLGSGFTIRPSFGLATQASSPDWQCRAGGSVVPCGNRTFPRSTVPVVTVAFGYAFGGS